MERRYIESIETLLDSLSNAFGRFVDEGLIPFQEEQVINEIISQKIPILLMNLREVTSLNRSVAIKIRISQYLQTLSQLVNQYAEQSDNARNMRVMLQQYVMRTARTPARNNLPMNPPPPPRGKGIIGGAINPNLPQNIKNEYEAILNKFEELKNIIVSGIEIVRFYGGQSEVIYVDRTLSLVNRWLNNLTEVVSRQEINMELIRRNILRVTTVGFHQLEMIINAYELRKPKPELKAIKQKGLGLFQSKVAPASEPAENRNTEEEAINSAIIKLNKYTDMRIKYIDAEIKRVKEEGDENPYEVQRLQYFRNRLQKIRTLPYFEKRKFAIYRLVAKNRIPYREVEIPPVFNFIQNDFELGGTSIKGKGTDDIGVPTLMPTAPPFDINDFYTPQEKRIADIVIFTMIGIIGGCCIGIYAYPHLERFIENLFGRRVANRVLPLIENNIEIVDDSTATMTEPPESIIDESEIDDFIDDLNSIVVQTVSDATRGNDSSSSSGSTYDTPSPLTLSDVEQDIEGGSYLSGIDNINKFKEMKGGSYLSGIDNINKFKEMKGGMMNEVTPPNTPPFVTPVGTPIGELDDNFLQELIILVTQNPTRQRLARFRQLVAGNISGFIRSIRNHFNMIPPNHPQRVAFQRYMPTYEESVIVGNGLKDYLVSIVKGRNDYPPKMRDIIKKYGDAKITKMSACRTPVPSLLTSALNVVSLGAFNKKWEDQPYDKLFHLDLRVETSQGTVLLEKNEVLNASVNPSISKDTECSNIQLNKEITINQLLEGGKKIQGDKFFKYSAYDNNCQDFIMALLKGSGLGSQDNYTFIKQDTKALFKGLVGTRKFANTITDIGAKVNTILEGASIQKGENYYVQSIVFEKPKWDLKSAKKWIKDNGYENKGADDKETQIRFRQVNPQYIEKMGFKRFRTKKIGKKTGISLIISYK